MTDKKSKTQYDWELIEKEFRAGIKTVREIAREHGLSHTAIAKAARRRDWVRLREAQSHEAIPVVDMCEGAGFIYVLRVVDTAGAAFHKIGLSAQLGDRWKAHQTSSPFEVELVCAYWVPGMRSEEAMLHHLFAPKRVRGEWFVLEHQDLLRIAQRSLRT